jgi:3alpha(or 20beta)-hydroxysteroid dehydrogenase
MARLDGKVAIVTGAARGAGAVIARVLVDEGAKVVLVDVRDELGAAVADKLGPPACFVHCDISKPEEWEHAVTVTLERFGQIDVLVNNAAVLHVAPLTTTTADDFRRVMDVNAMGAFLGIQAVAGPMRDGGGGSIINITSISSLEGTPGCVAYSASKWALRGITRTAALELGPDGIRVNALNPCAANLEMVEPFLPPGVTTDDLATGFLAGSPLRHGDTIEERLVGNARIVAVLASDEARYFSGVDLDPSSGVTASFHNSLA